MIIHELLLNGRCVRVLEKPHLRIRQEHLHFLEVFQVFSEKISDVYLIEKEKKEGKTNRQFQLTNIQQEDVGWYDVVATDIRGSTASNRAGLSAIIDIDPPFDPSMSIASENDDLSLTWEGEGVLETCSS